MGPAQTSEPTIQFLYQLLDAIAEGRILIPRFQRPLVWEWDRQSELLRSIKDGIPIGAIMLWQTSRDRMKARGELAGHVLSIPDAGTPRSYLLDGLQRLSTLFAALRGFSTASDDDGATRPSIGYDLETEELLESCADSEAPSVLPLQLLLDSVRLLRFQRGLQGDRTEIWIERSDLLAKAFREYKVPVISIASDEFEVAARTLNAINNQGLPMGEADMIHALTWNPDFELRERISALRDELLQPMGWGSLGIEIVLRVVKAEAGLDLYEESVEEVSQVIRADRSAVDRAVAHLAGVARLLRERCGIYNEGLVPYQPQVVLLADALRCAAGRDVDQVLEDWFWLTTYGELFAGLSGFRTGLALSELRATVEDGQLRWSGLEDPRTRAFRSADFRPVRMKTVALTLARQQKWALPDAKDPFQVLADHWPVALFAMVPRRELPKHLAVSAATRFLCEPDEAGALRQRLLSCQLSAAEREAHVISDEALEALRAGNWSDFVVKRGASIQRLEAQRLEDVLQRHPLML